MKKFTAICAAAALVLTMNTVIFAEASELWKQKPNTSGDKSNSVMTMDSDFGMVQGTAIDSAGGSRAIYMIPLIFENGMAFYLAWDKDDPEHSIVELSETPQLQAFPMILQTSDSLELDGSVYVQMTDEGRNGLFIVDITGSEAFIHDMQKTSGDTVIRIGGLDPSVTVCQFRFQHDGNFQSIYEAVTGQIGLPKDMAIETVWRAGRYDDDGSWFIHSKEPLKGIGKLNDGSTINLYFDVTVDADHMYMKLYDEEKNAFRNTTDADFLFIVDVITSTGNEKLCNAETAVGDSTIWLAEYGYGLVFPDLMESDGETVLSIMHPGAGFDAWQIRLPHDDGFMALYQLYLEQS